MITLEQAVPGTELLIDGQPTTILSGHYEDPELGLMIKSTKFPGGYPAEKYSLTGEVTVIKEPAVTFEVSIVEKEAPVKVTAALIREKSGPLMALTIESVFDEKGYDAVKKAKMKAVKMRTAIKGKEDEVLKAIKTRHADEIKQVTDYTAELYTACLEAQNNLQGKLDKIDKERQEANEKLAADKKAKTDGRNAKMYEFGMKFNGTGFMEYGKYIAQDILHEMSDEKYAALLIEIEGLSMEQGATGATPPAATIPAPSPAPVSSGGGWGSQAKKAEPAPRVYDTAIYEQRITEAGLRIIITNGKIEPEADAVVANDRILESNYYLQVVR